LTGYVARLQQPGQSFSTIQQSANETNIPTRPQPIETSFDFDPQGY